MPTATKALSVLAMAVIGCLFDAERRVFAMPDPQAANSNQFNKLLTDRNIWGDDAFQLFASLDRWRGEGETSILIFNDRVVGGSKFETREEAQKKAAGMARTMTRAYGRLTPDFATVYKPALAKKSPALLVESTLFLEDDSYRLEGKREGAEFLKKQLTMRSLVSAYGAPEKTTTEVVQARGDRRPAVLTISEYAGGTIKFVQSDLSADPNIINRVVLDVSAVAARVLASH